MGVNVSVRLVVGAKIRSVPVKREEARFDEKTGLPTLPAIKTSYELYCEDCLMNQKLDPSDWHNMDPDGGKLGYFKVCGESVSPAIVGICVATTCDLMEGGSLVDVSLEYIHETIKRVDKELAGIGVHGAKIGVFLMPSVSY